jgi:hypothetical protein
MVCGDRVVVAILPPSASERSSLGDWPSMPGQDDESWAKLNGSCEDVQYPIYYIDNYQVKYFLIIIIN